jgi:hypothetical protein
MRPLPYHCSCNIPLIEKWRRYVKQAFRECELVEAVLNGYKPKIIIEIITKDEKTGEASTTVKEYVSEVDKIDDFNIMVKVDSIEVKRGSEVYFILCDIQGQPLYRRRFIIMGDSTINLRYCIGVEKREWVQPQETIW